MPGKCPALALDAKLAAGLPGRQRRIGGGEQVKVAESDLAEHEQTFVLAGAREAVIGRFRAHVCKVHTLVEGEMDPVSPSSVHGNSSRNSNSNPGQTDMKPVTHFGV